MTLVLERIEVFSLLISTLIGIVSLLVYWNNRNKMSLFLGTGFIVYGSSFLLTFIAERPSATDFAAILLQTFAFLLILFGFFKSLGEERSRIAELSLKNRLLESEIAERKRAEEMAKRQVQELEQNQQQLRQSEARFRAVLNHSYEFIGMLHPDGTTMKINHSALEFTGVSESDIVNRPIWETPFWTHSAEMQERVQDAVKRAVLGETIRFDATHRAVDGHLAYFDFSIKPVFDESGNILYLITEGRDISERRYAEQNLRESERRFADIISFLPDATFVIDKAGTVLAWNRAMEKMTGVPAKEIIGKGNYEYSLPFYQERRPSIVDLVLHYEPDTVAKYPVITREGETLFSEIFIPHLNNGNGAYLWFTASPLYDATGSITGAIESIRDITQRKLAEDALKESKSQLHSIITGSPIPQYVIDGNHRVLYWNDALAKYSGIRAEEVIGTTRQWKAFYDQERPCMADLLLDGTIGNVPELHEGTYERSKLIEGAYEAIDFFPRMGARGTWLYITTAPVKDEHGVIIGAVETLSDITEERAIGEALRMSEEKFRRILDNIQDVYYRSDRDGTLIMFSPSGYRLLGYDPDDNLLGSGIAEILYVNPSDRTRFLETLGRTGSVRDFEVDLRHKSGGIVTVSVSSHYYYGPDGTIAGVEGIFRDITGKKKAMDSIRQSLLEKEVLLKEIHHRVKNNLQSIWGLIDLQMQAITDPATINTLRDSQNRIRAMALIHETLYRSHDLSHIDFSIYLKSLVTAIMSTYAISPGQIMVQTEIEETPLDVETGIACGLIVNELLSNTIKHAFPGDQTGEIQIGFRGEYDEFILQFSDNGIGIPIDFDPGTTTSLGLRLVYILACDQLDGNIQLIRGNGTRFEIRFPKR